MNFVKTSQFVGSLAIATLCGLCRAQSFPPVWNSNTTYAVGDIVQDGNNIFHCTYPNKGKDPTLTYHTWELYNIRKSTTLKIGSGQTFPDLNTAWNYMASATIASNASVHIQIVTTNGNFSETFSSFFNLDNSFGGSIDITGDNAANIALNFSQSDGFHIDTGHTIKSVSNVTVNGPGSDIGFVVDTNASLPQLQNIQTNGLSFTTMVSVANGGQATVEGAANWTTEQDCVVSSSNGVLYLPKSSVLTAYNGSCATAKTGGRIFLGSGSTLNTAVVGATSTNGGQLYMDGCTVGESFFMFVPQFSLLARNAGIIHAAGADFSIAPTFIDPTSYLFTSE